jgi:hypothetical protein
MIPILHVPFVIINVEIVKIVQPNVLLVVILQDQQLLIVYAMLLTITQELMQHVYHVSTHANNVLPPLFV